MRKQTLINRFLSALKKEYGGERVYVSRDGDGVLITSFSPPESYNIKETMVYIEIPEGFGYGVNITNSYILLDKEKVRHHLIPIENIVGIVQKKFNLTVAAPGLKKREWYWICFYVYGDRLYDENTGNSTFSNAGNPGEYTLDFMEYLSMLKAVLTSIASEDREVIESLERMNSRRGEILAEQNELIDSVKLGMGWRRLTWIYD